MNLRLPTPPEAEIPLQDVYRTSEDEQDSQRLLSATTIDRVEEEEGVSIEREIGGRAVLNFSHCFWTSEA